MADDARHTAIKRAVREMLDAGQGLGADKVPDVSAVSEKLGFKVTAKERDRAYKDVTKNAGVVEKPRPAQGKRPAGYDDLQLETVVQIAAKCMRSRHHIEGDGRPSHLRLASLCALPVTPEARDWACAEAYRRSESLDPGEIVAQSLLKKTAAEYEAERGPDNVQTRAEAASA